MRRRRLAAASHREESRNGNRLGEPASPNTPVQRVIESAVKQSVALQLGTVQPMPAGVAERARSSVVVPTAGWVEAGARKPIATIEWSALTLAGATRSPPSAAIPDVYIDDTTGTWSPTESAENELAKAVARVLDAAILWGVNAPAGFPVGGIAAAAGAAQTGADALEAIDKALAVIETDGLVPNGIASSAAIGAALRAAYRLGRRAARRGARPSRSTASRSPSTSPWDSTQGRRDRRRLVAARHRRARGHQLRPLQRRRARRTRPASSRCRRSRTT